MSFIGSTNLNKLTHFVLFFNEANIDYAQSLNCIQCSTCGSSDTTATACTAGLDTCIKSSLAFPSYNLVQKGCVTSSMCTAKSFSLVSWGFSISCCTTDGCNSSSSLKPKVFAALAMAFLSLFCFHFREWALYG